MTISSEGNLTKSQIYNPNAKIFRCTIDLSGLERECTHGIWKELDDGAGSLYILLTISGTTASETISDLTTYEEHSKENELIAQRYVS